MIVLQSGRNTGDYIGTRGKQGTILAQGVNRGLKMGLF